MKSLYSDMEIFYRHYRNTSAICEKDPKASLTGTPERGDARERSLRSRKENFWLLGEGRLRLSGEPYKALGPGRPRLEEVRGHGHDRRDRVETLRVLHGDGVYIDILEFKGEEDAGARTTLHLKREWDFSNPLLSGGGTMSGGTRSAGTSIVVPLEFIEQNKSLRRNHARTQRQAFWRSRPSSGSPSCPPVKGSFFNLRFRRAAGNPPRFSQVDERYIKILGDGSAGRPRVPPGWPAFTAKAYGGTGPVDMRRSWLILLRWMHHHRGDASGLSGGHLCQFGPLGDGGQTGRPRS